MKASETTFEAVIEGTQQYVVPLFQRAYAWRKENWDKLWDDLCELSESDSPRGHFIGSIVTIQAESVPQGVTKYLLIDGQQRLTTLLVILALLRDTIRSREDPDNLADEINDRLLLNVYKKGDDRMKLLPTQADRDCFASIIRGGPDYPQGPIMDAYLHFQRRLKRSQIAPHVLKRVIAETLSLVAITLGKDDNPYLVFESLNAKGRPLSQADLIRNYFFLRIHRDRQDEMHARYWAPMEERLGESLAEFVRHYLMKGGAIINQQDVYQHLKNAVETPEQATDELLKMARNAEFYGRLLEPRLETHAPLSRALARLNRLDVTTAFPLLLNCYDQMHQGMLKAEEFVEVLRVVENFLIRRYVCNVPTNQLRKIFPPVYRQAASACPSSLPEGVKQVLQARGYPKDSAFRTQLTESNLYGAGDRNKRTRLILESIEESYGHKEAIDLSTLSVEHIMPQSLGDAWRAELGEDWQETFDTCLHTIGNLSLTGYNPELSNRPFAAKRELLLKSNLEINRYFANVDRWRRGQIEDRASQLADRALEIWPYFGNGSDAKSGEPDYRGTPTLLTFLGRSVEVVSWRDVVQQTCNILAEHDPERFRDTAADLPRLIGADGASFRASRPLDNGMFANVDFSSRDIKRVCLQALDSFDIDASEWNVTTKQDA